MSIENTIRFRSYNSQTRHISCRTLVGPNHFVEFYKMDFNATAFAESVTDLDCLESTVLALQALQPVRSLTSENASLLSPRTRVLRTFWIFQCASRFFFVFFVLRLCMCILSTLALSTQCYHFGPDTFSFWFNLYRNLLDVQREYNILDKIQTYFRALYGSLYLGSVACNNCLREFLIVCADFHDFTLSPANRRLTKNPTCFHVFFQCVFIPPRAW